MFKYRNLGRVGEGTFSEVIKAQSIKTGTYMAIKCECGVLRGAPWPLPSPRSSPRFTHPAPPPLTPHLPLPTHPPRAPRRHEARV